MRKAMPKLSHWFGLTPADVDSMSWAQIAQYLQQIPAQPIGSVQMVTRNKP